MKKRFEKKILIPFAGPKWYPFVGSSNAVRNAAIKHGSQFKGLIALSKEYSTDVLGLKLGGELIIVVYGEKNVRQVFTEKTFEGRPNSFFLRLRCLGKKMGEFTTNSMTSFTRPLHSIFRTLFFYLSLLF